MAIPPLFTVIMIVMEAMRNIVGNNGFVSYPDSSQPVFEVEGPAVFKSSVTAPAIAINCTRNQVWVNKNGNDVSGNGTFTNPYLTIKRALQDVSAPSAINTWAIMLGAGQWDEDGMQLASFVSVYGAGTGTTKVKAATSNSIVFEVTGSRCRLEHFTIFGKWLLHRKCGC